MDSALVLSVLTGITFIIFLVWELKKPARSYEKSQKENSYITNAGIFVFNNIVTYLLSVSAIFALAINLSFYNALHSLPLWIQYILGILFLDLVIWFWHMINHKVTFLWSFHQAHHAEKYLNASSAVRFHVGELMLSVLFKSFILIMFGIPLHVFLLYESFITLFAIYHHANIKLPEKIQNSLEYVIISPRLHRTHHSTKRKEHDSNYGVLFSWWDIIFKTKNTIEPKEIGLSYGGEKNLWSFLAMPLTKK